MIDMLKTILSLSLSGGLLILVLFLGKFLWKNRLSRQWQYYIWLIVVIRFLLPFAPEGNLMTTFFLQVERVRVETQKERAETLNDSEVVKFQKPNNSEPDKEGQEKEDLTEQRPFSIATFLFITWMIGILIALVRKITVYQSFVRYVKAGQRLVDEIEKLNSFGRIIAEVGIKRRIELATNSLISTPLLLGFFRPCIVLPTLELSDSDFCYTIRHELVHYKRQDMLYKWLVQLVKIIHWFNPFVYLMEQEINRACELSCDEAVTDKLNEKEKIAYGDTLLNAIGAQGNYKDSSSSIALNESKKLLKERLGAIMENRKKSKLRVGIAFTLTLFLFVSATTIGVYAKPKSKPSSSTNKTYTYVQKSYYQEPYIFVLGWNLDEKTYLAYPDKTELTLSDQSTIIVSFDSSCKEYIKNPNILSALSKLIEKLKTQSDNTPILERPFLSNIKYVGNNSLEQLAEEYYTNEEHNKFYAIFPELDKEMQKEFCNRMYEDGKNSMFAVIFSELDDKMQIELCDRMYEDGENAMFSASLRGIRPEILKIYAQRAYEDGENAIFAIIFSGLDDEMQIELCDRMYEDRENGMFSAALRGIHPEVLKIYAERAYQDDEIAFFSNLVPYITEEEREDFLARASREDKNNFLGVLKKYKPEEEKANQKDNTEKKAVYVCYDATTYLDLGNNTSLIVTDNFNKNDIPKKISNWIATCQDSKVVNVKKTVTGEMIDAWVYYNSEKRLAWDVDVDGKTIKLTFLNAFPSSTKEATLIHYQAPVTYDELEVVYNKKKLTVKVE